MTTFRTFGTTGKWTKKIKDSRFRYTGIGCSFCLVKGIAMKYVYIWLVIINIITFFVFGIDKKKAIKGKFRISELTLFVLSLVGGSLGGLAGMYLFRHKTKKLYFKFGIPLILILHVFSLALILKNQL